MRSHGIKRRALRETKNKRKGEEARKGRWGRAAPGQGLEKGLSGWGPRVSWAGWANPVIKLPWEDLAPGLCLAWGAKGAAEAGGRKLLRPQGGSGGIEVFPAGLQFTPGNWAWGRGGGPGDST